MYNFGTHGDTGNEVTLTQDTKNYAGKTLTAGSTVRGNLQDFGAGPVLMDESWYTTFGSGFGSLKEQFVEDGSWTRLRQLSLSYRLDSEKFRKVTKLQSIEFSLRYREGVSKFLVISTVDKTFKFITPINEKTLSTRGKNGPYWSPDGTKFAFSMDGVLWTVAVDKEGNLLNAPIRLTNELAENTSWTGDSKSIVYIWQRTLSRKFRLPMVRL